MFPGNSIGVGQRATSDDTRIRGYDPAVPPGLIQAEISINKDDEEFLTRIRQECAACITRTDPKGRLLVVVGPCSLHDPKSALEYARKLKGEAITRFHDDLLIVMRAYLEKPRTTVGWKGMINDPNIDGTFEINKGLRQSRGIYRDMVKERVPVASEMLDTISPQYVCDLVSWGAIGARTTESQLHRELASGLSFPVGFKNATDGNVKIALDAIQSSMRPHHFLSVTKQGVVAIVSTEGNEHTHVILRGGSSGPNYGQEHVQTVRKALKDAGMLETIMIDCSHGNSSKNFRNQPLVAGDIAKQIAGGEHAITGVMIESHLFEGNKYIF